MKVVAAYLLAVLGGNPQPSTKDLQAILRSVGSEAEDDMIRLLLMKVQGKDITELIATRREKFSSVPSGGGGGAAISVAAAGSGGGSTAAPAAAESRKEEKVTEKEESNEEMGFSLFD